ncbi:MAG: hypothetical protein ACE1ZA_11680, partial [Pseudomonadales bacterium]
GDPAGGAVRTVESDTQVRGHRHPVEQLAGVRDVGFAETDGLDRCAPISDFTGYANPNRDATALVDPAITSDPAIYPDAEVQSRLQSTMVYEPKIERLRSRVWSRVKTGL